MNHSPSGNTALRIGQEISSHLDILIALAHFMAFIIASHDRLRLSFNRQSQFNSSLVDYIMREVQGSLLKSGHPELLWKHSLSVGAITELVVQTRYQVRAEQMMFNTVNRLLRGDLEVQYILGMHHSKNLCFVGTGLYCHMVWQHHSAVF